MKKYLIFSLIVVFVLTIGFMGTGCKATADETTVEETTATETAAETTAAETTAAETTTIEISKIGYSPLSTQLEYFQRVILGLEKGCEEIGAELLLDDPQMDLDKQLTGLENLLTAGAQALIICSLDPVAVEAAVDEAHSKSVPVVSHVSSFENADVYVGLDEYNFGYAGGEGFAKALQTVYSGTDIKIAVLAADQLGEGLVQRVNGEIEAIQKYYPDAEVVAKSDAFDEATALTTLETMLQANPDINVVACSNDPGAYGAISAIEGAGLKLNEDIFICCLGDQFKTLDLVEEGKILASVSVSPEATGKLMIEVSAQLISGEAVEKDIFTPYESITKDNVKDVREFKLSFGPME